VQFSIKSTSMLKSLFYINLLWLSEAYVFHVCNFCSANVTIFDVDPKINQRSSSARVIESHQCVKEMDLSNVIGIEGSNIGYQFKELPADKISPCGQPSPIFITEIDGSIQFDVYGLRQECASALGQDATSMAYVNLRQTPMDIYNDQGQLIVKSLMPQSTATHLEKFPEELTETTLKFRFEDGQSTDHMFFHSSGIGHQEYFFIAVDMHSMCGDPSNLNHTIFEFFPSHSEWTKWTLPIVTQTNIKFLDANPGVWVGWGCFFLFTILWFVGLCCVLPHLPGPKENGEEMDFNEVYRIMRREKTSNKYRYWWNWIYVHIAYWVAYLSLWLTLAVGLKVETDSHFSYIFFMAISILICIASHVALYCLIFAHNLYCFICYQLLVVTSMIFIPLSVLTQMIK